MTDLETVKDAFCRMLELTPERRAEGLAEMEPVLRGEVLSLLAAHESAGSFLSEPGDHGARTGDRIGPYLLEERIGAGGMGVVYRARRTDGEFEREVAIKLVGGRLFSPDTERRFIGERRILARLDHPNIVRMIDGGVWQGQRYLVMELVAGTPITDFAKNLGLTEKLRLFQEVCRAVQSAHQKLIVHRDLKPGNILVTAESQVKVLDFGIARLLDESGDDTLTGFQPMSLACASPEQINGEPVTVASDVYALGLLLHELLTGVGWQSGQPRAELLRRITDTDPPAAGVAADIDSIVLKALAKEPARRYQSVADLASDVARFQGRRPVLARPPSWRYRAGRFAARNRALTASLVALALAIGAGSGLSVWQARRAESQRQLAEKRFSEARRLVHTVIHEIQPKLAAVNGTVTLRKELIEKTLVYLEALGRDSADNPALLAELIEAYLELSKISGSASGASAGNADSATKMLAKAETLVDALEKAAPIDTAAHTVRGRFYRAAALHASTRGDRAAAKRFAAKALPVARGEDEEALANWTLAAVSDSNDEKERLFGKAAASWNRARRQPGGDTNENRRKLSLVYRNLATVYLQQRRYDNSLAAAQDARRIDEELLARTPASPEAQLALAFDLGAIGAAREGQGNYREAVKTLEENLALRQRILEANPDDRRAADRVAYALHDVARAEVAAGELRKAKTHFQSATEMYARSEAAGPLFEQSQFIYVRSSSELARLALLSRDPNACRLYGRAVSLSKKYQSARIDGAAPSRSLTELEKAAAACH